jgi:hypothetical protein
MFMTTSGFLILVALASLALWVFVELASLPGKKAAQRNHPQAEAINILGWLGLLFGGVGWVVALVWTHMKPVFAPVAQAPAGSEAGAPVGAPAEES